MTLKFESSPPQTDPANIPSDFEQFAQATPNANTFDYSNEEHLYFYKLDAANLSVALEARRRNTSSEMTDTQREQVLTTANALLSHYTQNRSFTIPPALTELYMLTHAIDFTQQNTTTTDETLNLTLAQHSSQTKDKLEQYDRVREARHELRENVRDLIEPSGNKGFDKHAVLRRAFDKAELSGRPIMSEHVRIEMGMFAVQRALQFTEEGEDPFETLETALEDAHSHYTEDELREVKQDLTWELLQRSKYRLSHDDDTGVTLKKLS